MADSNIKIFVVFHKDYWQYKSQNFIPIQVGKGASGVNLDMISDDTGDNISFKNPYYCELTAQYWAYKNIEADYIGFCHYRRYFDFNEEHLSYNQPVIYVKEQGMGVLHHLEYARENEILQELTEQYDLILPQKYDLGNMTLEEHYKEGHIASDWDILEEIVMNKYPEYEDVIESVFRGNKARFLNMFIMKSDIFKNYMAWLFDITGELEKRLTLSDDPYQKRVFGFMSERLFTVYVEILIRINNIKYKELPVVMIVD